MYEVAIELAHSASYDFAAVMEIFCKYGDHMYKKKDFDGAILQVKYYTHYTFYSTRVLHSAYQFLAVLANWF